MTENIFIQDLKEPSFQEYLKAETNERGNLGDQLPVFVYRLLEYSLREQLIEAFGKEKQIELFRNAGYAAGVYFTNNILDKSLPLSKFLANLQASMAAYKIGVLRIESLDEATGRIVLTVAEDADCSGLPLLGETVCNYDEGFIAGILSTYTGRSYEAREIDCWATGDRVCRFHATVKES